MRLEWMENFPPKFSEKASLGKIPDFNPMNQTTTIGQILRIQILWKNLIKGVHIDPTKKIFFLRCRNIKTFKKFSFGWQVAHPRRKPGSCGCRSGLQRQPLDGSCGDVVASGPLVSNVVSHERFLFASWLVGVGEFGSLDRRQLTGSATGGADAASSLSLRWDERHGKMGIHARAV